ncbi:MAG TPA: histone deacetylase [Caldimonas sp.]|nr:histone deacetylase [Caldimonas sp.]
MQAFHSDRHLLPLPPGHRFPRSKYRLLRERVASLPGLDAHEADPVSDADLMRVHDPAYVAAVTSGTLGAAEQRAIGFPWSEEMVERSRRSVGATVAAARAALAEGVAANLAGGTHHASASRGSGYCVFNDVAVASRLVQAEAPLRIVVVDLDVHQGDGTAAIFAGDASVFTISLHGAKNFPFRKAASDLDVALPDRCGDADYLGALDRALDVLVREHRERPFGLAFYLAGADPHEGDRLGRLKVSAAGLLARDRRVLGLLGELGIPVALAMAGGYGHDLDVTVAIQAATIETAIDAWRAWRGRSRSADASAATASAQPALAVDNRGP